MRAITLWTALMVASWDRPWAAAIRYIDGNINGSPGLENYGTLAEPSDSEKRVELSEPSCEELRAMWRYTKRQSRAAKTNTGYSLYPDPFAYNVWQPYPERAKPHAYKGRFSGRARSRAAGGAPVYGRVVHKAPAGSRLRNGMRHRARSFVDVSHLYGTVNRYPTSSRRRLTSFRAGGGMSSPVSQVPQAGSFDHLKELIRAERARELQGQQFIEEPPKLINNFEDNYNRDDDLDDRRLNMHHSRKQFLNPLPPVGAYHNPVNTCFAKKFQSAPGEEKRGTQWNWTLCIKNWIHGIEVRRLLNGHKEDIIIHDEKVEESKNPYSLGHGCSAVYVST